MAIRPSAAGAVFHDHRLPPALGEAVRQQPRADIGAAARPERDDEFDRPRRPIGRRCGDGDNQGGDGGEDGQGAKAHDLVAFAAVRLQMARREDLALQPRRHVLILAR
jgi:hypothetical protein